MAQEIVPREGNAVGASGETTSTLPAPHVATGNTAVTNETTQEDAGRASDEESDNAGKLIKLQTVTDGFVMALAAMQKKKEKKMKSNNPRRRAKKARKE